jgi:hypothetical protein
MKGLKIEKQVKYIPGRCPNCDNKGWRKSPKSKSPIHIYKTEMIGSLKIRYCVCKLCDFQFKVGIEEKFIDAVNINYFKGNNAN